MLFVGDFAVELATQIIGPFRKHTALLRWSDSQNGEPPQSLLYSFRAAPARYAVSAFIRTAHRAAILLLQKNTCGSSFSFFFPLTFLLFDLFYILPQNGCSSYMPLILVFIVGSLIRAQVTNTQQRSCMQVMRYHGCGGSYHKPFLETSVFCLEDGL